MAPRKSKHQHSNSLTVADTASSSDTTQYIANLNLGVLQKHDQDITHYLWVAPYCVIYNFHDGQWEKSGQEGSLFICGLRGNHVSTHRFKLMMLNRRGLDNFSVDLGPESEAEFTDELIMVTSNDEAGNTQTHGLWIFSEPEASTANQAKEIEYHILECLRLAKSGQDTEGLAEAKRLHQMANNDAYIKQENAAPPQQQFLPTASFGQQRTRDDAWAEQSLDRKNRSPQAQSLPFGYVNLANQAMYASQFDHTPSPMRSPPTVISQPQTTAAPLGSQQQHLLGLFQKAKIDHS